MTPSDRGVAVADAPDVWLATSEGFRTLRVEHAIGEETLDGQNHLSVQVLSSDLDVQREDLLGRQVTLGVRVGSGTLVRHGYVLDASIGPETDGEADPPARRVDLRIGDALTALRLTHGYGTFEDQSELDVIAAVLARSPAVQVSLRARARPTRPLIAQYEQSDLQFVQDLAARAELVLRVEHQPHGHTLVIEEADRVPREHTVLRVGAEVQYAIGHTRPGPRGYRLYDGVRTALAVVPGARPEEAITFRVERSSSDAELRRRAALFLAYMRAPIVNASLSTPVELGARVRLRGHERPELNGDYRVVRQSWSASGGAVHAEVELMGAALPVLSQPLGSSRIPGVQRAVVVRVEAGRARVRLDWAPDASGSLPECWVALDGREPPAVGETLVLAFEDGDPARPLVVR